jgi:type I restriction enzyme, S subunit
MNKIDELIKQYCPSGVSFCFLKNECNVTIGEFVHKDKQSDNGKYPVYNGGIGPTGYYDQFNNTGAKIIISARGANAGFINRIESEYWAGNSCYSLAVIDNHKVNFNFIYFYLKANQSKFMEQQQKGGIPAVSKKQVEEFIIPIPPLPIQEEIVNILDKFTQLEAELEAELEARLLQYDYYRNQLLAFDTKVIALKTLEEVCIKTNNIRWKDNTGKEYKYIDLSAVNRENNKIEELQVITSENAPSRAQQIVIENDIIFGTTRPTLKRYAVIPEDLEGQICSTGFCVLRPNIDFILPRFLFYILKSNSFFNYVDNNQEGAGYPSISNSKVKSFTFPIPPLKEQESIVTILDKFDALVNDIKVGLPAEIQARNQQYEYYRKKLLTFKNVN